MRKAVRALLAALVLCAAGTAGAADVEPIDDLQWLFIEDTVALITPPNEAVATRARALMEHAATARAAGQLSDMRRSLAEARIILAKGEWTPASAFVASLAIRPHESVIDPAHAVAIEIGQYFQSQAPSAAPLTFDVGLRSWRPRGPASTDVAWRGQIKTIGNDLLENPVVRIMSFEGVADGSYDLVVRASHAGATLGTTARRVFVVNGLRRDLQVIATRAAQSKASESALASIRFPADLVKTLNERTRQVRALDFRKLIDRAVQLLDAADAGRDPVTRATGSVERHYWQEASARYEPYRLIIPERWDGRSALPLVVVLHGSNGDHDSVLANRALLEQAHQRGWALLSPMGYSPNSGWGNHLPVVLANGTMPRPRPSTIAGVVLPQDGVDPEPAERDVLRTIELVRAEYPIDARRIYLMGNSMGGEGTWHLAARAPALWAAVAPAAGAIDPDRYPYESLGKLPVLAIHGQRDPIVSYDASRTMVERLESAGGSARLLTVADAGHDAVNTVLPRVFDFFARHTRKR